MERAESVTRSIYPSDTVNVYGAGKDVFRDVVMGPMGDRGITFTKERNGREVMTFLPWHVVKMIEKVTPRDSQA